MFPFQNYNPYCFLPPNFPISPQSCYPNLAGNIIFIQHLNNNLRALDKENQELQNQINKLNKDLGVFQAQIIQKAKEKLKVEIEKSSKNSNQRFFQKEKHTKDKVCFIEGCSRKYSSRIALRAHLRKCHNFKTKEDFEGKI